MSVARLGDLDVIEVGAHLPPSAPVVLMLHGYAMTAADLAPFAAAVKLPVRFLFVDGPLVVPPGAAERAIPTRTFWPVDPAKRTASLALGPRDFADLRPDGLDEAREAVVGAITDVERRFAAAPMVLGGFSQGAMLAMEVALRGPRTPDAVVLMAGSRVAWREWAPLVGRLRGVPVLMSHGRHDPDVGFAAGEALRDALTTAGASVTWSPFEGGHEVPLSAWRQMRALLTPLLAQGLAAASGQ